MKEEYIILTNKAIKDLDEGKLIKKEGVWEFVFTQSIGFNCWEEKK